MTSLPAARTYGSAPFRVAVLHGGPGALGYLAPVAARLAQGRGVVEPLQRASSVTGQLEELGRRLDEHTTGPVDLVGHSWGAVEAYLFAAAHPDRVRQVVMVAAAPFEARYADSLWDTRVTRLGPANREAAQRAQATLADQQADPAARIAAVAEFDRVTTIADGYDLETADVGIVEDLPDVYDAVWQEAAARRRRGELVRLGRRITCPVLAIHGDHDPHPAAGVETPLSPVVRDFTFVVLERCGHIPWLERHARASFFELVDRALARPG